MTFLSNRCASTTKLTSAMNSELASFVTYLPYRLGMECLTDPSIVVLIFNWEVWRHLLYVSPLISPRANLQVDFSIRQPSNDLLKASINSEVGFSRHLSTESIAFQLHLRHVSANVEHRIDFSISAGRRNLRKESINSGFTSVINWIFENGFSKWIGWAVK